MLNRSIVHRAVALLALTVVLAACSSDPEPTATPSSSPTASPSPAASPAAPGAEPEPAITEQGGTYWGVYLAIGSESDLEDAIQYLTEERGLEAGIDFSIGDISCDEGAAEALGADEGAQRVAVYFASSGDATAWAATLPGQPVGIVEVKTFCLD